MEEMYPFLFYSMSPVDHNIIEVSCNILINLLIDLSSKFGLPAHVKCRS
jgi:hypothetical protein